MLNGIVVPGTFRYAEPDENDDALCHKLTSLFEVAAMSSVVPIRLTSEHCWFKDGVEFRRELKCNFPVDASNRGQMTCWVRVDNSNSSSSSNNNNNNNNNGNNSSVGSGSGANGPLESVTVALHSGLDVNRSLRLQVTSFDRQAKWVAVCLDDMASELLALAPTPRNAVFEMHCALVQQKLEALAAISTDDALQERVSFLAGQAAALRKVVCWLPPICCVGLFTSPFRLFFPKRGWR